ncbi:protein transport protein SEC16B homolog isoform X1 [Vigna radiata var. radiata]|uniref:Protein transport protein sec16 n=1 Tax=Vigna radiata var. radiata TaxID=3916 RepID=A0A1S3UWF5_VIGRR|nr:protein transport protein SEC16B homolog isoform X1 [Vigna radiata var. radiata]
MASNPPLEDQTDEDFFDKLVEDDNEHFNSGHGDEGYHNSDDVKAFPNLGIDGDAGECRNERKQEEWDESGVQLDGGNAQEGGFLASSGSFGGDSAMDRGDHGMGLERSSVSDVSKSNGINNSEVKEVGWNSFNVDANGDNGFGSYSDFFGELVEESGKTCNDFNNEVKSGNEIQNDGSYSLGNYEPCQEGKGYDTSQVNKTNGQDLGSTQYWEDLYPGWKYDQNTGQWYMVDGHNDNQGSSMANTTANWATASDTVSEVSYMQQTAQSMVGTLAGTNTTESVSCWNQASQGNNGYPEHMVFDPQYPGWYYDMIAQEWRSLETYHSFIRSAGHGQESRRASTEKNLSNDVSLYREYGQDGNYGSLDAGTQTTDDKWSGSYGIHHLQGQDTHTTERATRNEDTATSGGNRPFGYSFGSNISVNKDQQNNPASFETVSYSKVNHDHGLADGTLERQNSTPSGNVPQHFNYSNTQFNEPNNFSNEYARSQKPFSYSQAQSSFQDTHQSCAPDVRRSSAGRPPHALVTFGFGGKVVVMKDSSFSSSSYRSQTSVQGSVSVLNLMEVINGSIDSSSVGSGAGDYFRALTQQSFPGPLVSGSFGNKELYKWIDERIAHSGSTEMDYKKCERLRLLLSLLKIACQHYGKLRSPFGTDTIRKENDTPEAAVAKLFASAKTFGKEFTQYGVLRSHCLQNLPSEAQMRATASEVQNLLVSGKKKEALQYAQEGQLWGPALVLASQLGDQFYVDTVKQMALRQLVSGSPLRTLCLLIAGQPAEVFSPGSSARGDPNSLNIPQQPTQVGSFDMLVDWEENLAVITANRTKDDELVIIHLGDCLWRETSQIMAAHICYLVAEANFESYSDRARLCLIGADHWKFPRTYASPEAIQRTELYEYSKVLGNSQFILLPLQPYKLIYAYMLAEVGKVSDSLKYCQAVMKCLKTGRAPEVETWKQLVLSLEDRIRTHQQGGYAANLAPAKLVGKLLNFFDSTAHRVVGGGLPPPAPSSSSSQGYVHGNGQHHQPVANRVSNSQSTMAMSSLVPSASMEPISDWTADDNKTPKPNRSVSEPDFGRSPRQGTSPEGQGKTSVSGGASRFSRFGFGSQLLQKTVELVLRPRPGRQAKLGEKNKFYYDEKLKRWVEEGVQSQSEETALPPPPKTAAFQNGSTEYSLKHALKKEGTPSMEGCDLKTKSHEHNPGIPPMPPSSTQFSGRGRVGVRSRYVDTFNPGSGSSAKLFQSSSVKPALAANAKFFVPAHTPSSNEQAMKAITESNHEHSLTNENPSTSYQSPGVLHRPRFQSMDTIGFQEIMTNGSNSEVPAHSRRTASWGGEAINDRFSSTELGENNTLGEALGMPPEMFVANDLQEVKL